MDQLIVKLPLPERVLSPNGRTRNYRYKAAATKKARRDAGYAALAAIREQGPFSRPFPWQAATIQARWSFKVRRTRDEDNLTAWLKGYCDGLADVGLVANDRDFRWLPPLQRVDPLKQYVELIVTEVDP